MDLIEELSNMLGFTYTYRVQEDMANGNFDKTTKKWTGMINEIIEGVSMKHFCVFIYLLYIFFILES